MSSELDEAMAQLERNKRKMLGVEEDATVKENDSL